MANLPRIDIVNDVPNASVEQNDRENQGALASAIRLLRGVAKESSQINTDRALQASMAAFIELEKSRYALDQGAQWEPGHPLKLLFAGYAGTRNTGADVRVEEMVRQFRHLLGDEHLDLSMLTIDPRASSRYFRTVKQIPVPDFFPKFLFDTVHEQHGVIACEGSMFKSKFANALSTLMVGALGLARARAQLAIGYGGEAGAMDPSLSKLVKRYCHDAFLITRNEESQDVLGALGIDSKAGTDTAWSYSPAPAAVGTQLLNDTGWDGTSRILCICPINAFWWPVKPNLAKGVLQAAGSKQTGHYRAMYFHADSAEIRKKQASYIHALAEGTRRLRAQRGVFPIIVGMEKLDRSACEALAQAIGKDTPVFVSDEYDMDELVCVLRHASWMVSSRYHALVTSMPPLLTEQDGNGAPASLPRLGVVASCGVTMDERIRNLMVDRGTPELALGVDDADLAEALERALERLYANPDPVRVGIEGTVIDNLRRMGEMGQHLVEHIRTSLPEFPLRPELGAHGSPWDHLPPLGAELRALLERRGIPGFGGTADGPNAVTAAAASPARAGSAVSPSATKRPGL